MQKAMGERAEGFGEMAFSAVLGLRYLQASRGSSWWAGSSVNLKEGWAWRGKFGVVSMSLAHMGEKKIPQRRKEIQP